MSQLTIYLPEPVLQKARREAKRRGQSVSAYVAQLLSAGELKDAGWSKAFLATYGAWKGDFPEIEDLPAEEREPLD